MAQSNDKVSSSIEEFEGSNTEEFRGGNIKKFEAHRLSNKLSYNLNNIGITGLEEWFLPLVERFEIFDLERQNFRFLRYFLGFRLPFEFGESENVILNEFISEKKLKWVPYNKFNNVEYLDKGGFSTLYKAIWKDMMDEVVVLKSLNNMNENSNDFLNEWKYQSLSKRFIKLYGFTKDPNTSDYMVIMDYANQGNLRGNLTRIVKYDWKQKLHMIYEIIIGLNYIHQQNLIHCDLHDGNILIDYGNKVYISDLGLCRPVKSFFKKDDIYGVIPFMAPEILRGKPYTLASDIYSFSMIMWEFTSGVPPFNDREHDIQLSFSICKGERPEITENTPQCYVDLMKKCWDEDPLKRPSSEEVLNTIKKWIFIPDQMEIKDINEELKSQIMEFINAPIEHKNPAKFHSQACYTSRLLNFTSEKLNDNLKSECLDCIVNDMNSLVD